MRACKDNSVFWYIVLQDVAVKDEHDCVILNLAPSQMILVEKLWVLGPKKALAQVVYPAKGYVPCERRTCGQLITRLNPSGPPVPKELIDFREQNINTKFTVPKHQSNRLFDQKEYRLLTQDQALSQGCRPYAVPGLIPRPHSYPSLVIKRAVWPRKFTKNFSQRTLLQQPALHCPEESEKRLQCEHIPPPAVDSCNLNTQYTMDQMNGSRIPCNLFDPALVVQKSRIGGGIIELHEGERDMLRKALQHQNSLIQRLTNIYHSDHRCKRTDHRKDSETVKELPNAVVPDRMCQRKPNDEKSDMTTLCKLQEHYRKDADRWVTVSALCHVLQTICYQNKRRVESKNLHPIMIFHSPTVVDISLPAYLKRIA